MLLKYTKKGMEACNEQDLYMGTVDFQSSSRLQLLMFIPSQF